MLDRLARIHDLEAGPHSGAPFSPYFCKALFFRNAGPTIVFPVPPLRSSRLFHSFNLVALYKDYLSPYPVSVRHADCPQFFPSDSLSGVKSDRKVCPGENSRATADSRSRSVVFTPPGGRLQGYHGMWIPVEVSRDTIFGATIFPPVARENSTDELLLARLQRGFVACGSKHGKLLNHNLRRELKVQDSV